MSRPSIVFSGVKVPDSVQEGVRRRLRVFLKSRFHLFHEEAMEAYWASKGGDDSLGPVYRNFDDGFLNYSITATVNDDDKGTVLFEIADEDSYEYLSFCVYNDGSIKEIVLLDDNKANLYEALNALNRATY